MTATVIDIRELKDESLKQELTTFRQSVSVVRISDQPSYDLATSLLTEIKSRQKRVVEFFAKMKSDAYSTWKEICSRENEASRPLADAEAHLKSEVARWTAEQDHLRRKVEAESREHAEREQAEALEAQIVEAEAAGASAEEVAAICEMPMAMPAPAVAASYQQSTAVSTRKTYRAEVTDVRALARAIGGVQSCCPHCKKEIKQDPTVPSSYIQPNLTALNARARADGAMLTIPGVRVVESTQVAVRTR